MSLVQSSAQRVAALRCAPLVLLACCACSEPQAQESPPGAPPQATSPTPRRAPRDPRYVRAWELEAEGRHVEAQAELEPLLAEGGDRDAKLLAAKLAILREDFKTAQALLEPLRAADPEDGPVQYNIALVAQKRGDFNGARSGYLAALRVDPANTAARYNLALLTWEAGALDEARHHAKKFLELSPDDPRAAELQARVKP